VPAAHAHSLTQSTDSVPEGDALRGVGTSRFHRAAVNNAFFWWRETEKNHLVYLCQKEMTQMHQSRDPVKRLLRAAWLEATQMAISGIKSVGAAAARVAEKWGGKQDARKRNSWRSGPCFTSHIRRPFQAGAAIGQAPAGNIPSSTSSVEGYVTELSDQTLHGPSPAGCFLGC
jgi:hypothetical protein